MKTFHLTLSSPLLAKQIKLACQRMSAMANGLKFFHSDISSDRILSIQRLELAAPFLPRDAKMFILQLLSVAACSSIPLLSFLVHHALRISNLLPCRYFSIAQARPYSRVLA